MHDLLRVVVHEVKKDKNKKNERLIVYNVLIGRMLRSKRRQTAAWSQKA